MLIEFPRLIIVKINFNWLRSGDEPLFDEEKILNLVTK